MTVPPELDHGPRTIRRMASVAVLIASFLLPAAASGHTIVVGSPIEGSFGVARFNVAGTYFNQAVSKPDAELTSPVDGVIVSFQVLCGEGGPFVLRVLRARSDGTYTAVGSSEPAYFREGANVPTFRPLPIRAGDAIGIDIPVNGLIALSASQPGSAWASFVPSLAEGSSLGITKSHAGVELGFNAQVLPKPTVTGVRRGFTGPRRRTAVVIRGTDFTDDAKVSFGKLPAVSTKVDFEGLIVAVAPRRAKGATQVRVTTEAGTSAANKVSRIVFSDCRVPRLEGMTINHAVRRLRRASCRLGQLDGPPSRYARVRQQSPGPGKTLPYGASVNVLVG
jgi:hypothetical protein